jgi:hypothetical protein
MADSSELSIVARLKDLVTPAMKKMAQEAGQASSQISGSLAKLGGSLKGIVSSAINVKNAILGFIGVQVAKSIYGQISALVDYGDALAKTAIKLGISTDSLQEWQFAAGQAGVETETFNGAIEKFSRIIGDAVLGGEEGGKTFSALGISIKDVSGQIKPTSDLMKEVADKIAGIDDSTIKASYAVDLFGRSGISLIPLLNEGGKGFEQMAKKANELGIVIKGDALKSIEEYDDAVDIMNKQIQNVKIQVLLPIIRQVTTSLNGFFDSIQSSPEKMASIQDSISNAADVFAFLGKTIRVVWNVFQSAFDFLVLGSKTVYEGVKWAFGGISDILAGVGNVMTQLITGNFKAIPQAIADIGSAMNRTGSNFLEQLRTNAETTNKNFDQNMQDIANTVVRVASAVKNNPIAPQTTGTGEGMGVEASAPNVDDTAMKQALASAQAIRLANTEERQRESDALKLWYDEQKTILQTGNQSIVELDELFLKKQQEIKDNHAKQDLDKANALETQLQAIRLAGMDSRKREYEELEIWKAEQQTILDANNISNEELQIAHQAKLLEINKKFAEEDLAFKAEVAKKEEAIQQAKIDASYKTAQAMIDAGLSFVKQYKSMGTALKIFAISEIGLNTARSAIAALAPPPLGLGPVTGWPLAASIGAKGLFEMNNVRKQKFKTGGFPQGRNAMVEVNEAGQEAILNAGATNRLGAGAINALNNNSPQAGGITNHISYAPTIHVGSSGASTASQIISALNEDKKQFADFFVNEFSKKGFLKFA